MSFFSGASSEPRHDKTITSNRMTNQTTMLFDELVTSTSQPEPVVANIDTITLTHDSDTNKLIWILRGASSYVRYDVIVSVSDVEETFVSTIKEYQLSNLDTNAEYSFQIKGLTQFGRVISSNLVNVRTAALHPEAFVILPINITQSTFEVTRTSTMNDGLLVGYSLSIPQIDLVSNTIYEVFDTMTYTINEIEYTLESDVIPVRTDYISPVINSLTVALIEHDSVDLSFDVDFNDSDISSRFIQVYEGTNLVATLSPDISEYPVGGLIQNTPYNFHIKLLWKFDANAQTPIDSTIAPATTSTVNPTDPSISLISKTTSSIAVNVDFGLDDGGTRTSQGILLNDEVVESSIVPSHTFDGLLDDTLYNIKLTKVVEGILYESTRAIKTFKFPQPVLDDGSFRTIDAQLNAIQLKWTIGDWGGESPLSIEIIENMEFAYLTTVSAITSSYLQTGLNENQVYTYIVRKNFSGGSIDSQKIQLQTYSFGKSDTILSVSTGFDNAFVSFVANSNGSSQLESRLLLYKKQGDATFSEQDAAVGFKIFALEENEVYEFQIKKITSIGTSYFEKLSNVVTKSTKRRPEAPTLDLDSTSPTTLRFDVSVRSYHDAIAHNASFEIHAGGSYTHVQYLSTSDTYVEIDNLTPNTLYDVRIVKPYELDKATYTTSTVLNNNLTDHLPVLPVTGIVFSYVSTTSLFLNWTRNSDGSDTGVVYTVEYYPSDPTSTTAPLVQISTSKTDIRLFGLIHNTEYVVIVHKASYINPTSTSVLQSTDDLPSYETLDIFPHQPLLTINEIRQTSLDFEFIENDNGTSTSVSFNIVYLDGANYETVLPSIAQNASGVYTGSINGLLQDSVYRIKVRKNTSLSVVFSETEIIRTAAPLSTLAISPKIIQGHSFSNKINVRYDPRTNGDAVTSVLHFYKSKYLGGITWEPFEEYDTTRDVITDTSIDTFSFDGMARNQMYTIRIKKVTDLGDSEVSRVYQTQPDESNDGVGAPVPGWWPPPSGGQPSEEEGEGENVNTHYTVSYKFKDGTLLTTNNESELTYSGGSSAINWDLNDPSSGRVYVNGTNRLLSDIEVVSMVFIENTKQLNLTFKIVVSSKSDMWRVQFGNVEVNSNGANIVLRLGGLAASQSYTFTYTKPSVLFNEYVFTTDEFYVNLYINGIPTHRTQMENGSLFYTDRTIDIQNLDSQYSIFEEITLTWGYCYPASIIGSQFSSRYSNGQQFMVQETSVTTVLNTDNTFTSTHRIDFTEDPVGYITSFDFGDQTISNTGLTPVDRVYTHAADGLVSSDSSSSALEDVAGLQDVSFASSVLIHGTSYPNETVVRHILDPYTSGVSIHTTVSGVYPTIFGKFFCKIDNSFQVDFYINSFANGAYSVIDNYAGTIFIDNVETPVNNTITGHNYGSQIRLPTTIKDLYFGNMYVNDKFESGLINTIIDTVPQNIVTAKRKELTVTLLPYVEYTTTYSSPFYTTMISIRGLRGNETELEMEVWVDSTEIDFTSVQFIEHTSTGMLTPYTPNIYKSDFAPYRYVVTGETIPTTPLTMTYKKVNSNQLFSEDPFRTIIYDVGPYHIINERLFNYMQVIQSTKEYEFYGQASQVGMNSMWIDLRLTKSNVAFTNIKIIVELTTGNDNKRIIHSITSALNVVDFHEGHKEIQYSSPYGLNQTDLLLGVIRLQTQNSHADMVEILDSHLRIRVDTYEEGVNTDFIYSVRYISFDYKPTYNMMIRNALNASNLESFVTLRKSFNHLYNFKFRVVYDNRRLNYVGIEYLQDTAVIIGEITSASGSFTTIDFELLDDTNSLDTRFYSREIIKILWSPINNKMSYTESDLTYTMLEFSHRDTPMDMSNIIMIPPVAQTPIAYIPTYVLEVVPTVTPNTNGSSTMLLQCSMDVSDHSSFNRVVIGLSIDPTKIVNSSFPTGSPDQHYTVYSMSPRTRLVNIFQFELTQFDRLIGFDESDITITLETVEYTTTPVTANLTVNTWSATVLRHVYLEATLNTALGIDLSLDIRTRTASFTSGQTATIFYNRSHQYLSTGSAQHTSNPYGWGTSNTFYKQFSLATQLETLLFVSTERDEAGDTIYYFGKDDYKIVLNSSSPSYTVGDTINDDSQIQSHVRAYINNVKIVGDYYRAKVNISKESLTTLRYARIDLSYDVNYLTFDRLFHIAFPTITTCNGLSIFYDNTTSGFNLTGDAFNLSRLCKISFLVLDKAATSAQLSVDYTLHTDTLDILPPPAYSPSTFPNYFDKVDVATQESLTYTPQIVFRKECTLVGPSLVEVKLFMNMGSSALPIIVPRLDFSPYYIIPAFEHDRKDARVTPVMYSDHIDIIFQDPSPSSSNQAEIELIVYRFYCDHPRIDVTTDDSFEYHVDYSIAPYTPLYLSTNSFVL